MKNALKIFPIVLGAAIIILGFSIITGISIPVFRILFGAFLVYLGYIVITKKKGFCFNKKYNRLFTDEKTILKNETLQKEYSAAFGNFYYDFSEVTAENGDKSVKIDLAFSKAVVKINKENPVIIKLDAGFAGAKTPDGANISFGSHEYKTASYDKSKNCLKIEIDIAFASLEII